MTILDYDKETGEVIEPVGKALALFGEEVNVMVATAQKFRRPKDRDIAVKIQERATLSSGIAQECLYSIPRDGKSITGPSIRFAEIIRSCYNNVWVRAWIVEDGSEPNSKSIRVGALAYDCETNQAESAECRRSIMTSPKAGPPRKYSADMINTTIMAAQAIAKRNAIIALIPKALWIDALGEVERVIAGDAATLNDRRAKVLKDFKHQFDVDAEALFEALGIENETEIGLNDLPTLRGMWARLKDGEARESVLGRAAARRAPPALPENPISNDSPQSPPGAPAEPAGEPEAKTQRARGRPKKPVIDQPAAKLDEAAAKEVAPEESETRDHAAQAEQESLEAAGISVDNAPVSPDMPSFLDRTGLSDYTAALRFLNEFKGTPEALLEWWRKGTKSREAMSFEECGHLNKTYKAKFNEINQ